MHEAPGSSLSPRRDRAGALRFALTLLTVVAVYAACIRVAEVDPAKLWTGLPRMAAYAARSWPPSLDEFDATLLHAAQTLAMATLGTTLGALLAAPLCLLAARNTTPGPWIALPARLVLNTLRGIDSFIFALLFVAAVGLGPFAGTLGMGLHAAGSIAKLWSESLETVDPRPVEAATLTGASRLKVIVHALLPDAGPALAGIALYTWEFNVRASTALGLVGAGGIGQDLKNAVDLNEWPRVLTILLVILAMVTAIDGLSARARRHLA